MTAVIHILDAHSANQIAAGEVVERPVSVVKELVENALDAGAKHIDITVEGNGVPLIRVRDDGSGISGSDLPLSVIRHATSKIRQIGDLDHLQTLGFRGEALPSIASVSHLEISTRSMDEVAGLCLILQGGEQNELTEVGCPVGTSVTVRNLFFNTPARLKFLKSTPTEFGLISDTIGRIALAHPDISFSLTHPHQVVLQTSGQGNLRETIGAVLGHSIARQLIPLQARQDEWHLEGFISSPELVRSSKQAQTFMINGRIIRSSFLSRAVEEGYHTLIPVKLHPIVVLHLHLPPSEYDVNVHPTKMDVRFKNEQALGTFISDFVKKTLIKSKPLPSFQNKTLLPKTVLPLKSQPATSAQRYSRPEVPDHLPNAQTSARVYESAETNGFSQAQPAKPQSLERTSSTQSLEGPSSRQSFERPSSTQSFKELSLTETFAQPSKPHKFEQPKFFTPAREKPGISESQAALVTRQESAGANLNSDSVNAQGYPPQAESTTDDLLSRIWPLAQLFNTYILATDGKVLVMIDQHAAHERINYERLLEEFKRQDQFSQALLVPLTLEFTLQEEQALLENLWALTEMGFVLEQFGSRTYLLRGVPVQTGAYPADRLLRQFIEEVLQKNSAPSFTKLIEEWIYLLACKESIKAQDSLSLLEMEQLIAKLREVHNPYTCPHGRPTMVKMTRSEIERRFYRT